MNIADKRNPENRPPDAIPDREHEPDLVEDAPGMGYCGGLRYER
jgi:hypothetical protein